MPVPRIREWAEAFGAAVRYDNAAVDQTDASKPRINAPVVMSAL